MTTLDTFNHETEVAPQREAVLQNLLDQEANASECMETLVRYAARQQAGDLFCYAQASGYVVKLRSDGMLHELGPVPRTWAQRFIGYAKVESRLDPSEHRRPQDGKILVYDGNDPIDVRISTMPTFSGEDLALRILDRRNQLIKLDNLGFTPVERNVVRSLIAQPHGLVLVSGSTGAGKTTTLYGLLNELNDGTRKINTIEDPVECYMEGIHQSQINLRIGMDFADLLPAALRQDPDVIMIGEVRDTVTATTAVRAAVTGQLVFATLHATRAAGAVHSMLGLGAHPHLLSGALRGVIAQHLLRRICTDCKEKLDSTAILATFDDIKHLLEPGTDLLLQQGTGCPACKHTGYRRRIGIFEMLSTTHALRELVERSATPDALEAQAIKDGMVPLRTTAKLAVARGITTLEEAMRVIDLQDL